MAALGLLGWEDFHCPALATPELCPIKFLFHSFKQLLNMKSAVGTGENMPPVSREENLRTLATQILKTMVLLGKPYGQGYVIHVLTAKKETQWRDLAHTQLETFGCVPGYFTNRLACVMHYLVDLGLVESNSPACSTLKITEKGLAWLDEPRDLLARTTRIDFTSLELYLRKALRIHRAEVAEFEGIQPYTIFTDYSLDRVVLSKPLGLDQLVRIPGFNTAKCEQFGPGIIHVVQDVIENFEELRLQTLEGLAKGKGYKAVKRMFQENLTLPEIAKAADLKLDTVVTYLCNLHEIGQVDLVPWIEQNINSKSLFKGVEYFQRVTSPSLKEAHVTLDLDYNTLKFAYLYKRDSDARKEEMRLTA
jgi:ATP-dependent DNA helicase RecQ